MVSCDWWERLSFWHSLNIGAGQSWEPIFVDWVWSNARRFLEQFVNCLLSTVASRLLIGQAMSCFCPANLVCGDNVAPLQLFNNLLDGLLEKAWTRGLGEIGACRAEYQSFVQEQRQLEHSSTRSNPDIGDVLSFCSAQAGFRARQRLYKVCIVINHVGCIALACVGFYYSWNCNVSDVPVNSTCDSWSCNSWREV